MSNDLSASREGYIPLFLQDKCINCGLCDTTCPDMVFQFRPGEYKGRKATLYVYEVRNDPSGEEGVTASLVLYRNRLIAADICSAQTDGFIRAVTERPDQKEQD